LVHASPDSARRLLDDVITYFTPLHYPGKLIPALVARASTAIARGDDASAESDLARAASLYDTARQELARAARRAALLAQAHSVFESLVLLRVHAGRPNAALAALEQGRLSFARSGRRGTALHARGTSFVDHALIGDTLLTWVIRDGDTTFTRAMVPRQRITQSVERLHAGLELGAAESVLRPDLEQLYDWLVRPVSARLGAANGAVTIVADGELLDVPWAALRDATRDEYLVDRYATRIVPALRDGDSDGRAAPATEALFVADPAIDRRAFPALAPLPGAGAEVRDAASLYGHPAVLGGSGADSAHLAAALPAAELFHFAGHAVLDDAEPDRSFLAVGPRGLTAGAIAALDLHRLRLVVLSACETMRSPDRSSGGFAGLADAFLAAGARGVVGSLWRVDDDTTRSLMAQFHRSYRRSGDPAAALREAQLAMRRAGASPSAWAAFRYAGH
jgi:CHAT domain-containing protein